MKYRGVNIKNPALGKTLNIIFWRFLDFSDDDEEIWNNCGIGKDHLGKYAFADVKHDGRNFRVILRDKEDLEHEDKKFNSLVNSVRSDRSLN